MATSKKIKAPAKPVSKKVCPKTTCKPAAVSTRVVRPIATRAPAKVAAKQAVPVIVQAPVVSPIKSVPFTVRAEPNSQIFIAGDFNKWDAAANQLTDSTGTGVFSTVLPLLPGSYEYKFVINGTWCVDPDCSEWVQNNLGTLNSVCKV